MIRRNPWNRYTLIIMDRFKFNVPSLVVLSGCFLVTFIAFRWVSFGRGFEANPIGWLNRSCLPVIAWCL